MNTEQERAEFEAWLRVKPCGAAHDFAWEAWQAALASPEVQALLAVSEEYSDLIRHMDAGGDFFEFIAKRAALAAMEKQK